MSSAHRFVEVAFSPIELRRGTARVQQCARCNVLRLEVIGELKSMPKFLVHGEDTLAEPECVRSGDS